MSKSDDLDRQLQQAEKAVWLGIKRVDHGDMVTHYERMVELKEQGDLDGLYEYLTGVQKLRDGTGLVNE